MSLDMEMHPRYSITCDGCQKPFADPEWDTRWWFEADHVTEAAVDCEWTTEGEGLEEKWHCPECPALGEEPAKAGPGQERLALP